MPFLNLRHSLQGSFGVLRYMEDPPLDGRGSIGNVSRLRHIRRTYLLLEANTLE